MTLPITKQENLPSSWKDLEPPNHWQNVISNDRFNQGKLDPDVATSAQDELLNLELFKILKTDQQECKRKVSEVTLRQRCLSLTSETQVTPDNWNLRSWIIQNVTLITLIKTWPKSIATTLGLINTCWYSGHFSWFEVERAITFQCLVCRKILLS